MWRYVEIQKCISLSKQNRGKEDFTAKITGMTNTTRIAISSVVTEF